MFKSIYYNVKQYSFLMKQLISRDFKVKYKRSVLGVLWSILYPVLMMAVMAIVFSNMFKFKVEGVNYLVYLFFVIMSFVLIVGTRVTDFEMIKNSFFPYAIFSISIIFLFVYSMELVFMKANKKWWYALIPFYCLFILADIAFKKKILGILYFIPFIGQVFFLVTLYVLATKFKYNGILSMIFPIIYIPLMGFGSRLYEGISYVTEDRTLENDYRRKKLFFIS